MATLLFPSISDFTLFEGEQAFYNMSDPEHIDSFGLIPSTTTEPSYRDHLTSFSNPYDLPSQLGAYSQDPSIYFHTPHVVLEAPTSSYSLPASKYTPSASPATSMSFSAHQPSSIISSTSAPSMQSATSSAMGSPYQHATPSMPPQETWFESGDGLGIVHNYSTDTFPLSSLGCDTSEEFSDDKHYGHFVDPSLIHHNLDTSRGQMTPSAPPTYIPQSYAATSQSYPPPSPAPSNSSQESSRVGSNRFCSPHPSYLRTATYHPYPVSSEGRRFSMSSNYSQESPRSASLGFDEDGRERVRCPNPDCGKPIKDLKAHMLTHQAERPEKCPIVNCEYHIKGFARKYDKQRHTLTHYKGMMVCGFCPGSGSSTEKSFNRADVFKRHLTSVHGVEQAPPNSRKKSPSIGSSRKAGTPAGDITGKCSTCSSIFSSAQDLYEHLDECVLRVVQQEEPSEAINEQHLSNIAGDPDVHATLDRHYLPHEPESFALQVPEDEDEEDDVETGDSTQAGHHAEQKSESVLATKTNPRSGKGSFKGPKRDSNTQVAHSRSATLHTGGGSGSVTKPNARKRASGLTFSKGGVNPLIGKGRKKRKHYPISWGMSADKMKMKKRVLCCFDGPRRLLKDEMMLDKDFEVRVKLGVADAYVTDLDVATIRRAEAFHDATVEEKGPWVQEDIEKLML